VGEMSYVRSGADESFDVKKERCSLCRGESDEVVFLSW